MLSFNYTDVKIVKIFEIHLIIYNIYLNLLYSEDYYPS